MIDPIMQDITSGNLVGAKVSIDMVDSLEEELIEIKKELALLREWIKCGRY